MPHTTTRLTDDALAFLSERHLAMLTTLRADNSPHVVAVGFTFDPKTHIARVITSGGSQKAVNADRGGVAVLSQVDGARWLSLEGQSVVRNEIDAVRDAELRYAQRYRTPRPEPATGGHRGSGGAGARVVGSAGPQHQRVVLGWPQRLLSLIAVVINE